MEVLFILIGLGKFVVSKLASAAGAPLSMLPIVPTSIVPMWTLLMK